MSSIHLCNHHVAVKRAPTVRLGRPVDVPANLGHDGGSKRDVGDKVPVPACVRARRECQPSVLQSQFQFQLGLFSPRP